jgi:hypothetical protein
MMNKSGIDVITEAFLGMLLFFFSFGFFADLGILSFVFGIPTMALSIKLLIGAYS